MKVNEIRGRIVAKGYTHGDIAKHLGISERTFSSRLKKGVFDTNEVKKLIDILDIKDPFEIFFN